MMIETDGPGGAEVMLLQLSEELRRRGHLVKPIGPSHTAGWLSGQLRNFDFDRRTYTLRRPLDLHCAYQMIQLLRKLRVDVVHSHEFTMAVYGSAATRWLGIPHVVTMHGNEAVMEAWRRRAALRWVARNAGAFVAVSDHTRRSMEGRLGLPDGAIEVVPNGVPFRPGDRDATRRKLGVDDDEVLLLTVGNLRARKGHGVLIDALGRLNGAGCGVSFRLAVAGGGCEREALERQAADLGLSDRVMLLGHRDDVPDLQAAADVYVMPSYWEGMPLAVLEAMIAGKAIVASRVGGIPEAIRDGETGLLVLPGDAPALAQALRRLIEDPRQRVRLGATAREYADREYHVRVMADRYERLYHRARADRDGRPDVRGE